MDRSPMHATRRIDGYSMAFVSARIRVAALQLIPVSLSLPVPRPPRSMTGVVT